MIYSSFPINFFSRLTVLRQWYSFCLDVENAFHPRPLTTKKCIFYGKIIRVIDMGNQHCSIKGEYKMFKLNPELSHYKLNYGVSCVAK